MRAALASRPDQYQKLGLEKGQVQSWEDGMRTSGERGSYEWWYFDGHLDDGARLVIVFFTKPLEEPDRPLTPKIAIYYDRADGTRLERTVYFRPNQFSASHERCEVRIGPSTFEGDLQTYRIRVNLEDITADLTLVSRMPPWRPETGHLFFGDRDEHYFAWLPAVPDGSIEGTLSVGGETRTVRGDGYHDHNWGDVLLTRLTHDWYWGRAKIGPYTVIACLITAEKRYDYATIPVFMLARDGKILADDAQHILFTASDFSIDRVTHKPVAHTLLYDYADATQQYRLTFRRDRDLFVQKLADNILGIKRYLARLIGFDGAYIRIIGKLAFERLDDGQVAESLTGEAIWELMYFGKTRPVAVAGPDARR